MKKGLICYFSASGVTKEVASRLASILNFDLFEIEPRIKYTEEDLDWTNENSRSSIEMKNLNSRPEVKNRVLNIEEYDTILLGFPIWWDLAPTIINTFIEENNLSNKKVYVFATSGSSSIDNSFNTLKNTYQEINFKRGKRLTINIVEDDIINWLNEE